MSIESKLKLEAVCSQYSWYPPPRYLVSWTRTLQCESSLPQTLQILSLMLNICVML